MGVKAKLKIRLRIKGIRKIKEIIFLK